MDPTDWISCAILARYVLSRRDDARHGTGDKLVAWRNAAVELAEKVSAALEPRDFSSWERAIVTGRLPMRWPLLVSEELHDQLERLVGDPDQLAERVLREHAQRVLDPSPSERAPAATA